MPVGDVSLPVLHPIAGVRIGVAESHIRYAKRKDLVVFELAEGCSVAAVFTQSGFSAAPVQVARAHLPNAPRYLLVNTGNANAATGEQGLAAAEQSCVALAALTGVTPGEVLPFSTGVIGEQLPIDKLVAGLPAALANLNAANWQAAASGIMTTDTLPKAASEQFAIDGVTYAITGISKGAGMIRPNMATMLSYVATDMPIAQPLLQAMLQTVVGKSFNRISIDGDTSTNDACVLVASGQAGGVVLASSADPRYPQVLAVVQKVFTRLAQLIVRDGEGATKFMTVQVNQGASSAECAAVAYAVAHSPLIKTAFFASDPNWGRILAAVGYAGISGLDVRGVNVYLDGVQICKAGGRDPSYTEAAGAKVMQQSEIIIRIDLGRGTATDTVWTCDLSYDYVKINADYRS